VIFELSTTKTDQRAQLKESDRRDLKT